MIFFFLQKTTYKIDTKGKLNFILYLAKTGLLTCYFLTARHGIKLSGVMFFCTTYTLQLHTIYVCNNYIGYMTTFNLVLGWRGTLLKKAQEKLFNCSKQLIIFLLKAQLKCKIEIKSQILV